MKPAIRCQFNLSSTLCGQDAERITEQSALIFKQFVKWAKLGKAYIWQGRSEINPDGKIITTHHAQLPAWCPLKELLLQMWVSI
jgi:hypothetical protein